MKKIIKSFSEQFKTSQNVLPAKEEEAVSFLVDEIFTFKNFFIREKKFKILNEIISKYISIENFLFKNRRENSVEQQKETTTVNLISINKKVMIADHKIKTKINISL